jgi:mono/diheme cytochrome c family protein
MRVPKSPFPCRVTALLVLVMSTHFVLSPGVLQAQEPAAPAPAAASRSVWDGVFTPAQADRGQAAYVKACAACHKEDLTGGSARPLKGDAFMENWREDSLYAFFNFVQTTMPQGAGGSLEDQTYADIVSYILRVNGFPEGSEELPGTSAVLETIRVQGKDGPQPVPSFALVRTLGCLGKDTAGTWTLTEAVEPVRTRDPKPSSTTQLTAAASRDPGAHSFQLIGLYKAPDAQLGHRVEVKGFIIREPRGEKLNVTALATIAPSCQP